MRLGSWRRVFPATASAIRRMIARIVFEKEILTDPWRDVVLQRIRFVPLKGILSDFRLFALLAPHLGNGGGGNTAWRIADCEDRSRREHHFDRARLVDAATWTIDVRKA
jgi:hypothetical protein